jgi:hypothetical protein
MVAVLSLSGKNLGECDTIISLMQKLKICGDVTRNISVDEEGTLETGCRVLLTDASKAQTVWNIVREQNNLTCAHIMEYNIKYGCVLDVFATSKCPSSKPNKTLA